MTTGKRIQTLRKERNMTQQELAVEIGAYQQNVSKWEKNEAAPTYRQANAMAILFEVSIEEVCDEYPNGPVCDEANAEGEVVTKDVAIEYIDWYQRQGNHSLRAMLISLICVALGLGVCELGQYGVPSIVILVVYIVIMIAALLFAKKIGLKNEMPEFSAIESGEFRLDREAEQMVAKRKRDIQGSVQITKYLGTGGIVMLLLWFFDKAYDAGWQFSNTMIIVYLIMLGVLLSVCAPTLNYWYPISKLLRETSPHIMTPFDKAFWKN